MKLLSKAVLALYLAVLLWLILFKFSLDITGVFSTNVRSLNLVPFANYAQGNLQEMVANFIVFIPFGLLLSVVCKQSAFWRRLAFIFAWSLAAETIQLACAIGAADITDVITNTAGGMLGLLVYGLGGRHGDYQKRDRAIVVSSMVLLALIAGILSSGVVKFQSPPGSKARMSSSASAQDLQVAWPAEGQAAVGTTEDGVLAHSADSEQRRPIASMAKVITALALMDKQPLTLQQQGKSYTMTAEDVASYRAEVARDGSVVPVYEGMVVTQYQALQMMLVASANNMADTLVRRTFGSEQAYVAYAQDMLQRKGFSQTVIADASGYSASTVSTPSEMVAIGIEALSNPVIAEIVAQQEAQIPGVGFIQNTNQLLQVDGVIGLKTGTTDEAGNCLLFAGRYTAKDGKKVTIVSVIMGATSATGLFDDAAQLLASTKQGLGIVKDESSDKPVTPPPMHGSRAPREL